MQLRAARLCLDCEEVHDEQHCPVCASDSFAYMSRWVPVDERRAHNRPSVRPMFEERKRGGGKKWVAGGALGVGVWALGRWLARQPRSTQGRGPTASESQ